MTTDLRKILGAAHVDDLWVPAQTATLRYNQTNIDGHGLALLDMPNSNRINILSISIFSKNLLDDTNINIDIEHYGYGYGYGYGEWN